MIPLTADRPSAVDGRVRVCEKRDGGGQLGRRAARAARQDAFLTVLREAFDRPTKDGAFDLYFGATSGEVFGSADAGPTWFSAATRLSPV